MGHVLFTGGGTAGHVVPTLPIIQAFVARGWQVSFVGSTSGLEERLLQDVPIAYFSTASGKLRRYLSVDNLKDVFRVLRGIWQAFWLLGRLRPDVVFSKGGFVSFPVVFAAWARRIPVDGPKTRASAGQVRLTPGLQESLGVAAEGAHETGLDLLRRQIDLGERADVAVALVELGVVRRDRILALDQLEAGAVAKRPDVEHREQAGDAGDEAAEPRDDRHRLLLRPEIKRLPFV